MKRTDVCMRFFNLLQVTYNLSSNLHCKVYISLLYRILNDSYSYLYRTSYFHVGIFLASFQGNAADYVAAFANFVQLYFSDSTVFSLISNQKAANLRQILITERNGEI